MGCGGGGGSGEPGRGGNEWYAGSGLGGRETVVGKASEVKFGFTRSGPSRTEEVDGKAIGREGSSKESRLPSVQIELRKAIRVSIALRIGTSFSLVTSKTSQYSKSSKVI